MITLLLHLLRLLPFVCGGHRQLALENLALRHQLAVYKRTALRPKLSTVDRLFWVGLARIWVGWRQSLVIVTLKQSCGGSDDDSASTGPSSPAGPPAARPSTPKSRRPGHQHGHREPSLGRPENPSRTSQARHPSSRTHRLQAAPEAAHHAVPDLADVPR